MNIEDVKKLALEWQEELNKEKQRKLQADTVSKDASIKINMYEGGLRFAEMLASQLVEQKGVVQLNTKASNKKTKP